MNPSLLCMVPLVVLVSLVQAHIPHHNHKFTIEVTVINHEGKIKHIPHKVDLRGDVEETKPLKLSVHYNTPKEKTTEVVDIDVRVSTLHGEIGHLESLGTAVGPTTSKNGTVTVPTCWKGYQLINGVTCYKKNMLHKTWKDAVHSCEEDGAHLVQPHTLHEMEQLTKFVLTHISSDKNEQIWVGAHKDDGHWETEEGYRVDSKVWAPKQPSGNGDCAVLKLNTLHDHPCHYMHAYVCEQPLITSSVLYLFL